MKEVSHGWGGQRHVKKPLWTGRLGAAPAVFTADEYHAFYKYVLHILEEDHLSEK